MTIALQKHPLNILQLDTDTETAKSIIQMLSSEGIKTNVDEVQSRKQLVSQLQKNTYDLIFLGDNARDCGGTDALKAVKKLKVYTPILVFSDILDEETIVNYINLGATDYILKTSLHRMVSVVRRVISNTRNAKFVDYQSFFETSPDLLCTCDKEGCFTAINQSWGHVFGYTDAELLDKPFIQFVCKDDQKSAAAQFQKLFDEKTKVSDLICRFVTTTEDVKWLHWKMKIQANGSINVIARDVTESRNRELQVSQAHQNLQKLVELYKADIVKKTLIADQIRDSVVVTDLKGNIVSWNKGSEKIFGYSPEEAVGQHIAIIYPEKDYKYIQEEATNVLLEQGSKEFELNMRRKNDEVFEARLTLEVTRDNEGKVNGMLGYAIDMGPVRKNSSEDLPVAHEAKEVPQATAEQVEVADAVESDAVVQSESGQVTPIEEILAEETRHLTEDSGKEQPSEVSEQDNEQISAEVEAGKGSQETDENLEMVANESTSGQQNIEINNVVNTPDDSNEVESTVVVDSMIQEEHKTVIAGDTEQKESVDSVQEEILETKQEDEQRKEQGNEQKAKLEIKQEVVEISVGSSEVSLMYLEDSLRNINRVETILAQRPDYRLITTQEPEDCVDMARQYSPTLILLDMNHSEADGYELLKQLQKEDKLKTTPVIAVSSDEDSEKVQAAKTAGFADYLVKPVDVDNFLQTIDTLLQANEIEVINKVSSV